MAVIIGYFWNKKGRSVDIPLYWFPLIGAIGGNFLDMDFFVYRFLGDPDSGWAHRSIYTHSILGIFLWPIVISLVIFGVHALITRSRKAENWRVLYIAALVSYASHLSTDVIEYYPTPLLYPFSTVELYGTYTDSVIGANVLDRIIMLISLFTIAGLAFHYYFKLKKERAPTIAGWIILGITVLIYIFATSRTLRWF